MRGASCPSGEPIESVLLRAMGKAVDVLRRLKLQGVGLAEQVINLLGGLNLAPHIRDSCVTVERGRNKKHGCRSDQRQDFVKIKRHAILMAHEETEARQQPMEVRIMPDALHTLILSVQPQRVESAD